MRVPLHIVEARRERLRSLIRHDGFLPLGEICRRLDISEATARRDLAAIEADGQITRTYGGALADYNASFASLGEREKRARSAKARIARVAAHLAPIRGTVFLDAGTTVLALARALARRRHQQLTVVTNGLAIASVLGGAHGITLHLLGGVFLNRLSMLFGDHAVGALDKWNFDAVFLGGEAMNADGVFNSHPETVRLHHAVLTRTEAAYFCIDATKLGRTTPHYVTVWGTAYHLITDAPPAQLRAEGITLKKPQLHCA
ncbi:MAG: DeoR/GlpR family DNA-binding transcription regulator [Puniceicoccales bacterium]|jgi:DeoR/GlpR family transcriptional regulator of sugar metabolism|nr:DeoR/GlpR family DNA-binding transcription regulator [Puniceicoccales bacterium]